jgi:PAS domain S-box-containing protein
MISGNCKMTSLSVVTVPHFFVICSSIIFLELACHAFLRTELNHLVDKHLVVEIPTVFFVTLFVTAFFLRKQQLAKKDIDVIELPTCKDDWEKTFNTMSDFVSVHDKDFKIIRVNNALCDFIGKKPDEITGKYCYQIFHNTNTPIENCPHKKTSGTGHSETEIINDPNIGIPLQITCSPLFDTDKTFQGSVHIARAYEPVGDQDRKKCEVIPICASCKSIRKYDNKWVPPEEYFVKKYEYQFTHSICRDCQEILYPEYIKH